MTPMRRIPQPVIWEVVCDTCGEHTLRVEAPNIDEARKLFAKEKWVIADPTLLDQVKAICPVCIGNYDAVNNILLNRNYHIIDGRP